MSPTFSRIGGAEPSTLTFKLATVTQTRNSTTMHQEILALGDPDTSNAIAAVLAATPASTAWGLVVRTVGNSSVVQATTPWTIAGNSTVVILSGNSSVFQASSAWQVQVTNQVRVSNSTAADFNAVISGNSTVVILSGNSSVIITSGNSSVIVTSGNLTSTCVQGTNPWIIAGNSTVAPLAGSTWNTRPIQSSAADLQMTATPVAGSTWNTRPIQSSAADLQMTATPLAGSTWNTRCISSSRADFLNTVYQSTASELKTSAWQFDGIGNAIESSTRSVGVPGGASNSTMRGMAVRSIMPALLSIASSNAFASTIFTIATSNAATQSYVYAYSITTTNQLATMIGFYAGSTLVWPLTLQAMSSAVSGVNLAVTPPAFLFAGSTGGALSLKTKGSTGLNYRLGVSYWTE